MAKSYNDFKNLLQAVYSGENVTDSAVRYWQSEMLNKNLTWGQVGGKIAWWKRQGRKLSDYDDLNKAKPSLKQNALLKDGLIEKAPLLGIGKPKTYSIKPIKPEKTITIKPAVEPSKPKSFYSKPRTATGAIKILTPEEIKATRKIPEANRDLPFGGSFEFGTKGTKNLLLPFVVVIGIVIVLLKWSK